MSNGVAAFRHIQAGIQTSRGTAVSASSRILGTFQANLTNEFYQPQEDRGSLIELQRAIVVSRLTDITVDASLQFGYAPMWLSMVLGNPGSLSVTASNWTGLSSNIAAVTATGPGCKVVQEEAASNDARGSFLWTFAPPPTSLTVPANLTFEVGDNSNSYKVPDVIARSMALSYEMNNAVMVSMDLFGQGIPASAVGSVQPTANTASFRVNDAISQFTDVYIADPTAANLIPFYDKTNNVPKLSQIVPSTGAATANSALAGMLKKGLMKSANITIPTGFEPSRYSSGSVDVTEYGQTRRSVNLDVVMRHSTDGKAELAQAVGGASKRLWRFVSKGEKHHVDYTSAVIIDLTVAYNQTPQLFTEENGDNLLSMSANGIELSEHGWHHDIVAYVRNGHAQLLGAY